MKQCSKYCSGLGALGTTYQCGICYKKAMDIAEIKISQYKKDMERAALEYV